ncbi:DUF4177 domain-containing protein [Jannaschia seohaensis]|uniref:DUF4177 domain-containing protein n=1 Tax=Jannaschia seohaensis TaxID=475081 RepID=A0A2Y9ANV9_9RHOB|nr:DUF4177 domain-containing protein [Jannaschia seohaensis]PWJ19398.1 hypothetical protein BCF38_104335 [Jannaschia seohaensis]SSA46060.1 hypothetical protein SAMN05421539_104335 [Jannaschia seohaensis]
MTEDGPHQTFEYRVVPAPRKGEKARGVRSGEARFALALSRLFNRMGAEGWEYVRADTLPAEERVGLTGKEVKYHALLVFRRALAPPVAAAPVQQVVQAPAPLMLQGPVPEWPGFEDEEIDEAEVIEILTARAGPKLAAE